MNGRADLRLWPVSLIKGLSGRAVDGPRRAGGVIPNSAARELILCPTSLIASSERPCNTYPACSRIYIDSTNAFPTVVCSEVMLILGYGGFEVTRNSLTIGGLVAFYGYIFRLFAPVSIAIDLQSRLQRIGASIRRIIELADSTPSVTVTTNRLPAKLDAMSDLEFKSVRFSYEDCRPVLRDMSFRIATGETVAIVGMNGSGKSTIGLLATRLYEPESGSIWLGGRDIREISPRSLRSIITLVPQDPILFDETIRGNLLYGNPEATNQDLDTVAALTQLNEVLQRVPGGFDQPLGPFGNQLSGGEKKRLALARALLQEPSLLILDEITSALDEPAAASILQGLDWFRKTRTLIIISHRPATILWADRILVVGEGAAVDTGKHNELIRRCPLYRRIWQSQDNVYSRIAHIDRVRSGRVGNSQ